MSRSSLLCRTPISINNWAAWRWRVRETHFSLLACTSGSWVYGCKVVLLHHETLSRHALGGGDQWDGAIGSSSARWRNWWPLSRDPNIVQSIKMYRSFFLQPLTVEAKREWFYSNSQFDIGNQDISRIMSGSSLSGHEPISMDVVIRKVGHESTSTDGLRGKRASRQLTFLWGVGASVGVSVGFTPFVPTHPAMKAWPKRLGASSEKES